MNGTVTSEMDPTDSGKLTYKCVCNACYAGVACDKECNNHGRCIDGQCQCSNGWRGTLCGLEGCPGVGQDCSGKGVCFKQDGKCACYNGWKGEGCNIPDCPGVPDCNRLGDCDGSVNPPVCVNCTNGTMGTACDQSCIHGNEDMARRGVCVCDPCYQGFACDMLCSGHGSCANNSCKCNQGWKGRYCNQVDCPGEPDCSNRGACISVPNSLPVCSCNPGFSGSDCSQLVCPGLPMCSNRGNCTLINGKPTCICNHGFDGSSCEKCTAKFAPPNCDRCEENYIGYNTDCSVRCVHGQASVPGGRMCRCFNDSINGYWNGSTCEKCIVGYALPQCTACDPTHTGPNCTVECVRANAEYKDPLDYSGGKGPVIPMIHCVETNSNGSIIYWLGYTNKNPHNVYLYVGANNRFVNLPNPLAIPGGQLGFIAAYIQNITSDDVIINYGQPTKFVPGKHSKVFKIR